MKVLVTGGSGVIAAGVIPELMRHGHAVRLLSRDAEEAAAQWPRVDPFAGDVADAPSIRGAAGGCDAIIHMAGIVAENPPEHTFEKVNAGGTRNIIHEAKRAACVHRFLYVSTLGADRKRSDYHRSKYEAEQIVEQSGLEWTIARPGVTYGPGDEVISSLLKMIRALPVVPVIENGEQRFQPIWFEDLGKALAALLERRDAPSRIYELAGSEVTTVDDVLRRLGDITGREPARVPVPAPLASIVKKLASIRVDVPLDETQLTMLLEDSVLSDPDARPLADLGVEETLLDRALRKLAVSIPEQLPEEGYGAMLHKRFWATIKGTKHTAATLMSLFRERITEIMPIDFAAEPDAPSRVELGITMTAEVPLRGHIQVRVERVEPNRVTFATVEGHPIAGIVEFITKDLDDGGASFEISIFARAGDLLDFVALKTVGEPVQNAHWRKVVQRMIELSGGTSDGVHEQSVKLAEEDAARVEKEIRAMIQARKRLESAAAEQPPQY